MLFCPDGDSSTVFTQFRGNQTRTGEEKVFNITKITALRVPSKLELVYGLKITAAVPHLRDNI